MAILETLPAAATPADAPTADGTVRLRTVSKTFSTDGPPVLDRISLDVAPGEFLCLVGASGCGKSTLLSMVAGLDQPTSGTLEVGGTAPSLMFQDSALFPWLTAAQNVELALRLQGMGRRERRDEALRLLSLVRLDGVERKRVHELSGGMKQRVALARSLAKRSPVLLMDEPFAALDAITRDVLHEELIRLWSELGLTVIFVTHNVREAVRLGQRVLLLSSRPGRIVREFDVPFPHPRRIESPDVSKLSVEITDELRKEIRRHGRH